MQTPMNYEEPIHRIIGGIVHSPAFADKLPQQREFYNLTPPEYWELLHAHASAFRMWKSRTCTRCPRMRRLWTGIVAPA